MIRTNQTHWPLFFPLHPISISKGSPEAQHFTTLKRSHLALHTWLTALQSTWSQPPLLPQQAEWESIRAACFGMRAFQNQATESPQFSIPVAAIYRTLAEIAMQRKQYRTIDTCHPGIKPTMRGKKTPPNRYWTQNKGVIPVTIRLSPSLWRCNLAALSLIICLRLYLWSDACSSALP